jgi:quinol monooxygenase YgiN
MWAQLITVQVRPGCDLDAVIDAIKAAELPGSGLIHETFTRDQKDPNRFHMFAVFQSEEMARAREGDPRRTEAVATIQSLLREILAGPPQFTDLDVIEDWTP